jgi:toxin CcdB
MARFRVYELVGSRMLAVDLQSDFLADLKTRVMVPLYRIEEFDWSFSRLTPRFSIAGEVYVMATQRIAAMEVREIGDQVANLSDRSDEIIAATDFLFQGF